MHPQRWFLIVGLLAPAAQAQSPPAPVAPPRAVAPTPKRPIPPTPRSRADVPVPKPADRGPSAARTRRWPANAAEARALRSPSAASGPTRVQVPGGIQVEAPNEFGGRRYSLYTFTNQNGGRSSVLYDTATGNSKVIDQTVSYGQVYYGPKTPGAPGITPLPGAITYGNGFGSATGTALNPSQDSQGPFGNGYSPGTGMPSINPVAPSYSATVPIGSPGGSPSIGGLTPGP